MHKELYKSGKSAIGPAILWIAGMYLFYILWGIIEIIIDIYPPVIVKHLILWALTGWFGWTVISKFMIEYELAARKNEIILTKILGKKSQTLLSIKYENIIAVFNEDEKEKLKDYKTDKKLDIIRAFQGGKKTYIIFKRDNTMCVMHSKMTRQMVKTINENTSEKKGLSI